MKKELIVYSVLLMLILIGCSNDVSNKEGGVTIVVEDTNDEMVHDSDDSDQAKDESGSTEVKEFQIKAFQWDFEPNVITVNEGDTVRLVIDSEDVDHGIAISEFNVREDLVGGQVTTVEFVADKKGSFDFICDVFCGAGHRSMKGTLFVE